MKVRPQAGPPTLLLLASGFGLWALAFVVLYGMLSIGCAFGWHDIEVMPWLTLQRLQLVVLLAVFLLAHAALLVGLRARPHAASEATAAGFVRTSSFLAAAAATAASAFTFMGVVVLSSCAP